MPNKLEVEFQNTFGNQLAYDGFARKYNAFWHIDFDKGWVASVNLRSYWQCRDFNIEFCIEPLCFVTPEKLKLLHRIGAPCAIMQWFLPPDMALSRRITMDAKTVSLSECMHFYVSYARPILQDTTELTDVVRFQETYYLNVKNGYPQCKKLFLLLLSWNDYEYAGKFIEPMRKALLSRIDEESDFISKTKERLMHNIYPASMKRFEERQKEQLINDVIQGESRIAALKKELGKVDELERGFFLHSCSEHQEPEIQRIAQSRSQLMKLFSNAERSVMERWMPD